MPDIAKPFDIKVKGNLEEINREIVRGRILDAVIKDARLKPGFNPAAISVVFGLKW